ncbi:acetoacetate decarboxylase family protein [Dactylosporangium sp. CA-092794]|uniref:acetoacetate decarboxylase family protein n=1 Tax=Dactylosporangium sp. CA-092794 TaxID=3239929 RepID=UPI003D92C5EE
MTEMYRMPIGFGPSLGPRQGPGGRRFTGEPIRTNLLTCSYRTDPQRLATVLPAPFVPAPDPLVTVRVLHNLGFPWLAGRAYNYFEVLFRAVHRGAAGETTGEFVAVMWESMADPIIVGRDEAGHPKLFADVPAPRNVDGGVLCTASWEGFEFARLEADGVTLADWPYDLEEQTGFADPATGMSPLPRFNYKYIPSTTEVGKAAVDEVVMIPAGVYQQKTLSRWSGTGRVCWQRARWEDLPTFAQVVNGLAGLPQVEPAGATLTQVVKLTNDLRDDMRILI